MSHEIDETRIVVVGEPAWHRIGHHFEEATMTAEEAFAVAGEYRVERERIYDIYGEEIPGKFIIVRQPTDDREREYWNVVNEDYELVPTDEFISIWDTEVGRPIETLGALKDGRILFVTTELPEINVKGDEGSTKRYLVAQNGLDGRHTVQMWVTDIRTVCWNTLSWGQQAATTHWRLRHGKDTTSNYRRYIAEMYAAQMEASEQTEELYNHLVDVTLTKRQTSDILRQVYKLPPVQVKQDAPSDVLERRQKNRDRAIERIKADRAVAVAKFNGEMKGYNEATKGTAYGLLQAIVETEDYKETREKEDQIVMGHMGIVRGDSYENRGARKAKATAIISSLS